MWMNVDNWIAVLLLWIVVDDYLYELSFRVAGLLRWFIDYQLSLL